MNYRLLMTFLMLFSIAAFAKTEKINRQPQGINGLYKFTGKLNGKYPVFLWFRIKDSVIKGEVTYLKTAKRLPITVIGTLKDDGIMLYEFTKNGNITGTWLGKFNKDALAGNWWAPGSEKELKYRLLFKDTVLANVDTALTAVAVNGEYLYRFGETGAAGGIDIKQTSPGNVLVDINCVTSSPANNVADLETFKARVVDNTILYKLPDQDCRFKIQVFNSFVVISYRGQSWNCGFGMNATIEGVFLKTSRVGKVR